GAHEVLRLLPAILDDSITGPYVVQQEVSEGMDDLVAQSGRDCEGPAIDYRTCRRSRNTHCVAEVTSYGIEDIPPSLSIGSGRQGVVAGRGFSRSHKPSKQINVVLGVLRVSGHLANGGDVVWIEPVRDSHLVEVGIAGER